MLKEFWHNSDNNIENGDPFPGVSFEPSTESAAQSQPSARWKGPVAGAGLVLLCHLANYTKLGALTVLKNSWILPRTLPPNPLSKGPLWCGHYCFPTATICSCCCWQKSWNEDFRSFRLLFACSFIFLFFVLTFPAIWSLVKIEIKIFMQLYGLFRGIFTSPSDELLKAEKLLTGEANFVFSKLAAKQRSAQGAQGRAQIWSPGPFLLIPIHWISHRQKACFVFSMASRLRPFSVPEKRNLKPLKGLLARRPARWPINFTFNAAQGWHFQGSEVQEHRICPSPDAGCSSLSSQNIFIYELANYAPSTRTIRNSIAVPGGRKTPIPFL